MPVIFHKSEGRWDALQISAARGYLYLEPVGFSPAGDAGGPAPIEGEGLLMRTEHDGHPGRWVLLLRPGEQVMHNGQPITAGIRTLAHGDALALAGRQPVFFSTEEPARIAPFAGRAKMACPRCRAAIEPGEPTVKCPGCGVFHHEMHERNCWTYAATCALCAQPTALDAGLQWTPQAL